MRVNIAAGIQWALSFLFLQLAMASGSFLFACNGNDALPCTAVSGARWMSAHPVFPTAFWLAPLAAFAFGAFGGVFGALLPANAVSERMKGVIAWTVVLLLVAAFALWGLPGLMFLQ